MAKKPKTTKSSGEAPGKAQSRGAKAAKGDKRAAKPKRISALDAAAKVLAEKAKPMNCKEMIEAMAAKGYWHSPGGKTPAATLYTAVTMLPKVA